MRHDGAAPAEHDSAPVRNDARTDAGVDARAEDAAVEDPVALALGAAARVVLAVSGGRDSMALVRAALHVAPASVAAVATFDHGTGAQAGAAADLVAAWCAAEGIACVRGSALADTPRTEAAWRLARWRFLRTVAANHEARVATAHTRDDQLETIIIRILRQAGARGLAGLDADSGVVRPWLTVGRAAVARYAARHGVPYVDDPSNQSRAFLRNRVRLDLLPALLGVRPTLGTELLDVADAAARWRRDVERYVLMRHPARVDANGLAVAAVDLAPYDAVALAVVWPVLAARIGLALDRRGTARLAEFTRRGKVGGAIQLSGGYEVCRSTFSFILRRAAGIRAVRRGPRVRAR